MGLTDLLPASDGDSPLERELTADLASLLEVEPRDLDVERPFAELGVDSMIAVQWTRALSVRYGVAIATTVMFDQPTIRRMAAYLSHAIGARPAVSASGASAANTHPNAPADKPAPPPAKANANADANAIAIIGMSGRFPQAETIAELWENLVEGRDCVTEIPPERWSLDDFYEPGPAVPGRSYSKWIGALADVDRFDAAFFAISPAEAIWMDPQQRLFLEECWRCLEDAGLDPTSLSGSRCGLFAGCGRVDYAIGTGDAANSAHGLMGTSAAILAGRVAYLLNLHGPCLSLNTASSSSLVAIAQACDSLVLKRSDLALAGGVCVLSGPTTHVIASDVGMLSSRGRCFSFDARADGFVPAEGVGVVLLKRLADARRDEDPIYAVIRGWAVNQDGKTNGITAPSAASQTRLERDVYEQFAIDPASITMVEAHGTGTKLGDPIEVQALTEAFRAFTDRRQFCALGSLKSNMGHPLAAAGVAGLIKATLALRHRLIPPTIQFERLNEHIQLDEGPFFINRTRRSWESPEGTPRRAAVSSFGYSGTNAHVVVEEVVEARPAACGAPISAESPVIVPLSARSSAQVTMQARALLAALRTRAAGDADLADIAFTLQVGRQAMSARLALVVGSLAELTELLSRVVRGEALPADGYRGERDRRAKAIDAIMPVSLSSSTTGALSRAEARQLAEQWASGATVDWRALYRTATARPRRVSLPTYPFVGDRYWIEDPPALAKLAPQPAAIRADAPDALLMFDERWEEQAPLADRHEQPPRPAADDIVSPRLLVCVISGESRQRVVVESLRTAHPATRVVLLERGATYQALDAGRHAVCSTDAESWRVALRAIVAAHGAPDAVWYLDPIDAPQHVRDTQTVLALIQAIGAADVACPRLLLAGTYATPLERCHLDAWISLGRSLRRTLPHTRIAVALGAGDLLAAWMSRLCDECRADAAGPAEDLLFEHGRRFVSRIRSIARDSRERAAFDGGAADSGAADGASLDDASKTRVRLRRGGNYLITGGAGALGMRFARHLAARFAANVTLVGRSTLDSARLHAIASLAAPGAQVRYVTADVSDAERLRQIVTELETRLGPIHGVIHAAGLSDGRHLMIRDVASAMAVLAPKVAGTIALDAALRDHGADFICHCSSTAGVLGDFGACDYALGNRFQLAFARYAASRPARAAVGPRVLAIAWPIWRDGRIRPDDEEAYFEATGQRAMESDEALACFEELLGAPHAAPMVVVGDRARMHRWLGVTPADADRAASSGVAASLAPARTDEARTTEPADDRLMARARLFFKKVVGARIGLPPERIDGEAPLEEYGIESVLVLHLTRDLEKSFGPLSPTLFFQHQTLDALTAWFVATHREALRRAMGDERPSCGGAGTAIAPAVVRRSTDATADASRDSDRHERDIAIIGMAGRYPHARDLEAFWENLRAGRDSITTIPPERWPLEAFYEPDVEAAVASGRSYCKWGGFIDGFTEFDPLFFGIAPRDAVAMDPQERLFLQTCWAALEDAGCTRETLAAQYQGRVGVFAGITKTGFDLHGPDLWRRGDPLLPHTSFGSVANRVSYLLNLHGPSMPIDTMCSASLTAIHEACEHLLRDECALAIAGGVNLYAHPATFVFLCLRRLLSPDGRCRSFGKGGNGMVPGEGAGVVLLKRLADAVRDGDPIHGVIRATHINHGGKTNGYTVPNPVAQRDLVRETLRKAGLHARAISYVEAHGTGTELGDPIEIAGLTQAYQPDTADRQYCAIGSVKSNIGHLEAAAGVAGLHKILLQMRHGQLAPSLHAAELNPNIAFGETPFAVQRELRDWSRPTRAIDGATRELPRIAALSSFGAGGSNAHLIVEEHRRAPAPRPVPVSVTSMTRASREAATASLIVLSARTPDRLDAQVAQLAEAVTRRPFTDADLPDVAYTLQVGREAMEHRLAFVAETIAGLRETLARLRKKDVGIDGVVRGEVTREQHALGALSADEDVAALVEAWIAKGKHARLLDLWVKGLRVDWRRLHGDAPPRRIGLPTYPFARESYWLPLPPRETFERAGASRSDDVAIAASSAAGSRAGLLHPLVHVNSSDLETTRFTTRLTGGEPFLADHMVRGARVLPAAAYVEMARAALELVDAPIGADAADAASSLEPARVLSLSDLVWQQPLTVGDAPVSLHIELTLCEDGTVACDIVSAEGLHAELTAAWRDASADIRPHAQEEATRVDLAARLRQCLEPPVSGERLYAAYAALGLTYGPAHRSVAQLRVGRDEHGQRFVLGELRLPDVVRTGASAYGLHPSLLDGALQTALGLRDGGIDGVRAGRPPMPFTLQRVELLHRAPASGAAWVHLRAAAGSTARVPKLDLDLCDEAGTIWARLRGLTTRAAEAPRIETPQRETSGDQAIGELQEETPGLVVMTPVWEEAAADDASAAEAAVRQQAAYAAQRVLLCTPVRREAVDDATAAHPEVRLVPLFEGRGGNDEVDAASDVAARFERDACRVLEQTQQLLREYPEGNLLLQVVVSASARDAVSFGLSGLLKTACMEHPRLTAQIVGIDTDACAALDRRPADHEHHHSDSECDRESEAVTRVLTLELARARASAPDGTHAGFAHESVIRYANGVRQVERLRAHERGYPTPSSDSTASGTSAVPVIAPSSVRRPFVTPDGVYLITGGAGRLGVHIACELARQAPRVRLVLAGRSTLGELQQQALDAIMQAGARVEYHAVDVANRASVDALVDTVLTRHGRLDGVLHCAGVTRDSVLRHKTREALAAVFAPKVHGLRNLDESTQDLALDFFIVCASLAGALGHVGQADYAAANGFIDRYMFQRDARVRAGTRFGRSLAIDWTLWADGGMRADAETYERMARRGLRPLPTEEGIAALHLALASGEPQLLVASGQPSRVRAALRAGIAGAATAEAANAVAPAIAAPTRIAEVPGDDDVLRVRVTQFVREQLAAGLGLSVDRVEPGAAFDRYGIDSILTLRLTAQLEKQVGPLSKTLLFEYYSVDRLTSYFLTSHRERLRALLLPDATATSAATSVATSTSTATSSHTASAPALASSVASVLAASVPSTTLASSRLSHRAASRTRGLRRAVDASAASAPAAAAASAPAIRPLDIAIIGVAGRYPQARTLHQFWENLAAGRDCIHEIQADRWERWDHGRHFDPEKGKPGKTYGRWGGFLDGVDEFDPLFFGITPRDAELMNPQERLFLQCVHETIEEAGYTRESLARYQALGLEGNVGVFAGVMYDEYPFFGIEAQMSGQPFALTGNQASIANRISYIFNLHGPSLTLNTMCSASLTALHLACESLAHGGCELAIAGGVNLSIHPNKYLSLARGQFMSSAGRCESFGAGGDGYVPGEGVGAVLLKPLARAEAEGDHIHAVIKGTAINHGGKATGYNVPNPIAQAQVIAQALRVAGVPARAISYVEAHGTGTSLGDPIEIAGLARAFREQTQETRFCAIGSAKSNIGHAESAAGIAGLTKVLLQMKHGRLAPSLHAETLNPHIDFDATPFIVQRTLAEWPRPRVAVDGVTREYPRLAGISSFGAGGANAHVVLQEHRAATARAADETTGVTMMRPALIVLSAKSDEQVREQARNLELAIETSGWTDRDLAGIAWTLQTGREPMEHRLACTAGSIAQLRERLERLRAGDTTGDTAIPELYRGEPRRHKEVLGPLTADSGVTARMAAWAREGRYAQLLDLWVKGMPIDWRELHGDRPPTRVSLPTYPFARERYWIPGRYWTANKSDASAASVATRTARLLDRQWRPASGVRVERTIRHALILASDETYALATRLSQRLTASTIVNADAAAPADRGSRASSPACDAWIDLVGCADRPTAHDPSGRAVDWIADLQVWIEQAPRDRPPIALGVTRGLEALENRRTNLAGAARVGFYRMLRSEHRWLRSRHVDVAAEMDDDALVRTLLDELTIDDAAVEVCHRGGQRYEAWLGETAAQDVAPHQTQMPGPGPEPEPEPEPASASASASAARHDAPQPGRAPATLPEDHVVWITGGTRGLGLACAQHLVRHRGVRRLWLTGREPLPPRETWARHRHGADGVALKIRAIEALEAEGAHVDVSAAPLDDRGALRDAVARVNATLGPIGGLLHCAGAVDTDTPALLRKRPETIARVMAPKVGGLENVLACLAEAPLRFGLLFSSVSATIPALAVGQSDYAAANACMDYIAQAHAPTRPIVSIQWPSWREVGMGEARSAAYRQSGLLTLDTGEALRMLERILNRLPDRVLGPRVGAVCLPAVVDLERWRPETLMRVAADLVPPAPALAAAMSPTLPTQPAPESAIQADASIIVETWVRDRFARELKMDPAKLEADTPLLDYGVDSVMLVQLLRPISDAIGVALPPSSLFEYPTVTAFAQWLAATHPHALARMLTPVAAPAVSKSEAATDDVDAATAATATTATATDATATDDIAVIGMSCRFPGAPNLDAYWRLLSEGRAALRPIPRSRLSAPSESSTDAYAYAGLLDDLTRFDPSYFLLSTADARAMDPQARIVLEEALYAWHHAGYAPRELRGSAAGVYLGARSQHRPEARYLGDAPNPIMAVGQNYLVANVARFFDLRGPALVVDTACSSALAAASLAIQALRAGEIDAALVGGVNVLQPEMLRLFDQRGLLARDARFHLFDRRASGTVLGEGAGFVILKPVARAVRDGDRIYAVVKAVALNNDGRTASPSAPNVQAQRAVMQAALVRARVRPEEVRYVQVNGSGSEVTDLLELRAIASIYRADDEAPCDLGSMKPNVGHPLCAEGIASLIQVVLMLHHRQLPPFLSATEPMAHYDWTRSPFRFARALQPWDGNRRIAAINAFADGGTNAHAIVASWDEATAPPSRRHPLAPPALQRIELFERAAAAASTSVEAEAEVEVGVGVEVDVVVETGVGTEAASVEVAVGGESFWKRPTTSTDATPLAELTS